MLKRFNRVHTHSNPKIDMDEQMIDCEEYLIRKSEQEKEPLEVGNWNQKLKLAKKYGCLKELTEGLYGRKDFKE